MDLSNSFGVGQLRASDDGGMGGTHDLRLGLCSHQKAMAVKPPFFTGIPESFNDITLDI